MWCVHLPYTHIGKQREGGKRGQQQGNLAFFKKFILVTPACREALHFAESFNALQEKEEVVQSLFSLVHVVLEAVPIKTVEKIPKVCHFLHVCTCSFQLMSNKDETWVGEEGRPYVVLAVSKQKEGNNLSSMVRVQREDFNFGCCLVPTSAH